MKCSQSQTEFEEKKEAIVQTDLNDFVDDKNVQTEDDKISDEFVKYPCNYCGTNIANTYHLFEHIGRCRGTRNMFTEPGLPVQQFLPQTFDHHHPWANPFTF